MLGLKEFADDTKFFCQPRSCHNTFVANPCSSYGSSKGFLNAYGVQLMFCPHTHSWLETLLTGLEAASGLCWQVCSQGQDLAALQTNTVENLLQPQNSSFPSLTVHEPNYCRGYFVATRATPRSKFKVEHHGEKYFLAG